MKLIFLRNQINGFFHDGLSQNSLKLDRRIRLKNQLFLYLQQTTDSPKNSEIAIVSTQYWNSHFSETTGISSIMVAIEGLTPVEDDWIEISFVLICSSKVIVRSIQEVHIISIYLDIQFHLSNGSISSIIVSIVKFTLVEENSIEKEFFWTLVQNFGSPKIPKRAYVFDFTRSSNLFILSNYKLSFSQQGLRRKHYTFGGGLDSEI